MFLKIFNNVSKNYKKSELTKGVALAVLFVQLAKVDNDFSDTEYALILEILVSRYKISEGEAKTILDKAEQVEQEAS